MADRPRTKAAMCRDHRFDYVRRAFMETCDVVRLDTDRRNFGRA